ncbi:hypothetical protein [Chitinophaga silvatica]|uniref:hypothetical protein n=1 Tax=Chitinophaga silvatica TaxID=2282649 RepID=UPI0011C17FD5|nr:hypothetical protein [Chitinophaga silvatica]
MSEYNSHNDLPDEQLPINIPSADEGWRLMQPLLDAKIPVHRSGKYSMGKVLLGIASLLVIATLVLFLHHSSSNTDKQSGIKDSTYSKSNSNPDNYREAKNDSQFIQGSNKEKQYISNSYNDHETRNDSPFIQKFNIEKSLISDSDNDHAPRNDLQFARQSQKAKLSTSNSDNNQTAGNNFQLNQEVSKGKKYMANSNGELLVNNDTQPGEESIKGRENKTPVTSIKSILKKSGNIISAKNNPQPKVESGKGTQNNKQLINPKQEINIIQKENGRTETAGQNAAFSEKHINAEDQKNVSVENNKLEILSLPLNSNISKLLNTPMAINNRGITGKKTNPPGGLELQLQWNYLLSSIGNSYYTINPNGDKQFYRYFVPAVRLIYLKPKSGWSLDIKPMDFQLYNDIIYDKVDGGMSSSGGTLDIYMLSKTFGYSISASYHHKIVNNWWATAGAELYVAQNTNIRVSAIKDSLSPRVITSRSEKSALWKHIGQLQGNAIGEIYYNAPRWQGGIRMAIPAYRQAKDSVGQLLKSNMRVELLFRFKIPLKK